MRIPFLDTGAGHSDLQQTLEKRERELEDARARVRQLEEALDARNAEAAALRRIGEATGHVISTDDLLPMIAEIATEITSTESAQIYLFDETRQWLVLRAATNIPISELTGDNQIRLRVGEGITGWVAQHKEHIAISAESWNDERFKYVARLDEEGFQSILSVPLIYRGDVIGVVNVRTHAPHEYRRTQVQLLSSIASQVAGAITATRRVRSAEQRASHLSTVAEVSKTIASNLYLEEILQLAVAATAQTMNFKIVALLLVDETKKELVLKATQSQSPDYVKKPNLPLQGSVAGTVIETGKVNIITDVTKSPDFFFPDIAKREGLTSLACIPLKIRERVIGVLNCYTEQKHDFSEDEIGVLTTLGSQVAVAIENSKLMVKGALLQEMHHRVKNNLQTVVSLLRLQSHYAADRSPQDVLNESINRVLAVAAVHDLLSREDLDTVSVKKIADSILTATKQSFTLPSKKIDMRIDGSDLRLPSHQANSVALILNELVSNAVEHGFAIKDEGTIWVRLVEEEERWRLEVKNDGDKLPDGFDIKKNQDLGLQIVDSLARGDLNGEFTLQTLSGKTVGAVTFPK